jgi:hypothetical protein
LGELPNPDTRIECGCASSVDPKEPIPKEIDHHEIAVLFTVVNEVQFLLAPEPGKSPKA